MNKSVIIGIIVSGIVIGVLVVFSFDSFSILKENQNGDNTPILENQEEEKAKPQGRDLTIEFDEKMGFSDP